MLCSGLQVSEGILMAVTRFWTTCVFEGSEHAPRRSSAASVGTTDAVAFIGAPWACGAELINKAWRPGYVVPTECIAASRQPARALAQQAKKEFQRSRPARARAPRQGEMPAACRSTVMAGHVPGQARP